jgi:hypothetical protein
MKVEYTSKNNRFKLLIEGESQRDVFETVSSFQEVFEEDTCGKCGSQDIKFVTRNVDDNIYYELRCNAPNCRAKLAFGANKKGGGLFPKRKDGDTWLADGGWLKWNSKTNQNE